MAAITPQTPTAPSRLPWPVSTDCLSDVLDTLHLEGVFNFPHDLEPLGECSACEGVPQPAEAVVAWRSRESRHGGFVYLEQVCPGCLYGAAMFELRRGSRVEVRVPALFGGAA